MFFIIFKIKKIKLKFQIKLNASIFPYKTGNTKWLIFFSCNPEEIKNTYPLLV